MEDLRVFCSGGGAPRWLRKLYEYRNRVKRSVGRGLPPAVEPPHELEGVDVAGGDVRSAKLQAVRTHGMYWEKGSKETLWSVQDAVRASDSARKPNVNYLKEILGQNGFGVLAKRHAPRGRVALVDELVLHVLWLDLCTYVKRGKGMARTQLPRKRLVSVVQIWLDFHRDRGSDAEMKEKRMSLNKSVLPGVVERSEEGGTG